MRYLQGCPRDTKTGVPEEKGERMTTTTLAPGSIVEHLDFKPECDNRSCDQPAVLALHMKCKCVALACLPCRNSDHAKVNAMPRREYRCRRCGADLGWASWEDLVVREVPL